MIGLIIVGDEILSGRRQDKHLVKTIELLGERGMALSWARYVGDDPARITAELRQARACGDVVFSCGGIGATPDDHTRACAAQAWDTELALHPQARELILARCEEMARQEGLPFEPASEDVQRRLQMGCFPRGAEIIPNPYNRIPGFSLDGRVHFLPGFPVMAWPMMAWLLDTRHMGLHGSARTRERSVIVYRAIESRLTPLMQDIETRFPGVKVFSLPSVDHPEHGRHIDLGVKGPPELVDPAFTYLLDELNHSGASLGPELVRGD
ncbi:competence/damage-inducible protein A [Aquabacterium fontiphilum]|jgi:molybdopterin-biosynthesis enzyme MoeA-like protein|uniref:competence/damage-inducible protein A n=1 Tax=Aquabacterium fontiphilum TaxID=450365 RepID=UPI00137865FA|nr:molybdopterin-binding protein [Aquabacterium fontiphilum]NBD20997.1 competence/damage-inducible protein A [Aquabacterium fontiphilum]